LAAKGTFVSIDWGALIGRLLVMTSRDIGQQHRSQGPPGVPFLRRGMSATTAAMNAWRSMVEDSRGRQERDQLRPGSRHEGDGNWLDAIGPEECWRLLAPRRLGRIGFTAHSGHPVILPVNYVVHDGTIVIHSGRGPKLEAARRRDLVAFEVDEIDRETHTGWSVVATGRARWVHDPRELDALATIDLTCWAAGPRDEVIVIKPLHIAGRRLSTPRADLFG